MVLVRSTRQDFCSEVDPICLNLAACSLYLQCDCRRRTVAGFRLPGQFKLVGHGQSVGLPLLVNYTCKHQHASLTYH
jgi:hypothetical protein